MDELWCLKCRASYSVLQARIDNELVRFGKANIHCVDGGGHDLVDQPPPEESIATHETPYLVQ